MQRGEVIDFVRLLVTTKLTRSYDLGIKTNDMCGKKLTSEAKRSHLYLLIFCTPDNDRECVLENHFWWPRLLTAPTHIQKLPIAHARAQYR